MKVFSSSNSRIPFQGVRLGALLVTVAALLWSCGHEKKRDVYFSSFDKEIVPERLPAGFSDTIPLIVGAIAPVEDGYWCIIAQNDNCMLATDGDFTPKAYFAHRGGGPGEVTAVSGTFGFDLGDNGLYSIFDANFRKVYGTNASLDYRLEEVEDLDSLRRYAVWKTIRLNDGRYVGVKGDNTCGLVEYNPADGTVKEWPLGFDPGKGNFSESEMSMFSVLRYNPVRGIVAVIYGFNPTVVLYDENGNVVREITYKGYEATAEESGDNINCYGAMQLTDNHIWLLYEGDGDAADDKSIMVTDYDGNPVARLPIGKANNFCVDAARGRLITIDTSDAESGVIVYALPDFD